MRDGWQERLLGDLFSPVNAKLGPHTDEPEVFSVTKYDGFVRAREYFDKRIASSKLDSYKIVEKGEWAYSTIHIDEGSIARNRLGVTGVVSPMYTTMRLCADAVEPFYCELLLRSPWMLARYGDAQQGSINRRKSLPWKVFASMTVPLPPRPEQERIVGLIEALDNTIQAAHASSLTVLDLRDRYLESQFIDGQLTTIGSLLTGIDGGRSPKASDLPPTDGQFGVLKVSAVTSFGFRPSEAKTVDEVSIFQQSHVVKQGDVLITRANTAALVGQVCVVEQNYPNLFLCDKTLRLTPSAEITPATLTAALNSPQVRSQLSGAATGTSASMKNVSQSNIRGVTLRWPADPDFVGLVDQQFLAVYRQNQDLIVRLQSTRTNLLTSLLSGAHQIPDSYDSLKEEAA